MKTSSVMLIWNGALRGFELVCYAGFALHAAGLIGLQELLMRARRMHTDEVDTDEALVAKLLAAQFPQWAHLHINRIASSGTDNAIYRLGDDMAVRLPRIHWATGQVEKEHRWLPRLAQHLPLAVPTPLAMGEPAEGYPWHWSVCKWVEGESATIERVADLRELATDLARFVNALRQIDSAGAPAARRGVALATLDVPTRAAIAALNGIVDTVGATLAWESALNAPEWAGSPVWVHGDLLPGNLIINQGHLSAVIDFGGLGVGDPACDLVIAWGMFSGESREVYREATAADDATWTRGRGHALSQALIFIPYYMDTNPDGVRNALRQLNEVLADYERNG